MYILQAQSDYLICKLVCISITSKNRLLSCNSRILCHMYIHSCKTIRKQISHYFEWKQHILYSYMYTIYFYCLLLNVAYSSPISPFAIPEADQYLTNVTWDKSPVRNSEYQNTMINPNDKPVPLHWHHMNVMSPQITNNMAICLTEWQQRTCRNCALLALGEEYPQVTGGFPSQKASNEKTFPCLDIIMYWASEIRMNQPACIGSIFVRVVRHQQTLISNHTLTLRIRSTTNKTVFHTAHGEDRLVQVSRDFLMFSNESTCQACIPCNLDCICNKTVAPL